MRVLVVCTWALDIFIHIEIVHSQGNEAQMLVQSN